MSHLDRTTYIADIVLAAKWMGILMASVPDVGGHRFVWHDTATHATIIGPVARDRINAFELACNYLVDYLKFTPKNPPYETHRQPSPDIRPAGTQGPEGG